MATWFQGPAADFIRLSREGFARGVRILHFLGGSAIDLVGERAIAQTKMTISQRGDVHGVTGDVVCAGRFFDFVERRAGRWGLVLREPIYEKDRLDPGRSCRARRARCGQARLAARGLSPPRIPSERERSGRQARHAAARRRRGPGALRKRGRPGSRAHRCAADGWDPIARAIAIVQATPPSHYGLAGSRTSGVESNSTFCSLPPTSSTFRM